MTLPQESRKEYIQILAKMDYWRNRKRNKLTAKVVQSMHELALDFHKLNVSRFLADRFVEGICPHCGFEDARGDQCDGCSRTLDAIELIKPRCLVDKTHVVTTKTSAHMYLKLDAIQPRTEEWIKKSWKAGKWSPNAVINGDGEIIDARLKNGLMPTPLTRDLKWGVPVPIKGEDTFGMAGKVLCERQVIFSS